MMANETEATSPEPEGLQFDHAEFENPGSTSTVACAACQKSIDDHYYEINGTIVCEPCRDRIEGQLRSGSGFLRFLKAIMFGGVASLVGAAIIFAVARFAPMGAGLMSILCGYFVGKSVRKGSGGRGGWVYQILAVGLTYLSMGIAYTSVLYTVGFFDKLVAVQPGQPPISETGVLMIKLIAMVFYVFTTPALASKEDFISLVILLIALWEAWKFTNKATLVVTGPYRVGDSGPDVEPEGVAGHA